MLIGEYKTKLGEKNRTAIPKKLRDELFIDGGEVDNSIAIVTRGYEGCLIIIDQTRWMKLLEVIEKKPLINQDIRNTKRFLIGGAAEVEVDMQGRFVIPENLIEYAHLENELVFVGIQDWIEIWDYSNWVTRINQITESAADIADRLSEI